MFATSRFVFIQDFENQLAKLSHKVRLSKGLWPRYMRGEVLPQGAWTSGRATLIERIDAIYPGTARIFHSPLWELMDFEKMLGPHELKSMYLRLDKEIWARFVSHSRSASIEAVAASRYWKIRRTEAELVDHLRRSKGLDGLSACLIEARMSYLMQEEPWFIACMLEGRRIINLLAHTPEFASARMQSALFLLEGLWIAHVREQVIAAPFFRDMPPEIVDSATRWEKQWAENSRNHGNGLSKSSRAVFERWRTGCAPSMPFR